MYQNLLEEKVINDLKSLIKGVEDFSENLDTEFIKYKMLTSSSNN